MAPDDFYIRPANARTRIGAGGVVARLDKSGRVLIALIRDSDEHEYVLPKGGVEKGESLEEAAMREIEEEAGFTRLTCLGPLGTGQRLAGKRNIWQTTHYFLFATDQIAVTPTEHIGWEVSWFELDAIPPMYWREQRALLLNNLEQIRRLMKDWPR